MLIYLVKHRLINLLGILARIDRHLLPLLQLLNLLLNGLESLIHLLSY